MMSEHILIVEDDQALVHTISRNLSVRGYSSTSASTVAEALASLEEALPSLLLLDIDLPDGSGWEVLRALRRMGGQDVPVIIVSALRPNPRLVDTLSCTAVLEKPFPMNAFVRLVTESLAPSSEPVAKHVTP